MLPHFYAHTQSWSVQAAQSPVIVLLTPSGRKDRKRGRSEKEEKRRERRDIKKKLWFFFVFNFLPFTLRRLTWQWPGIADGFGRTPVIRVFFNALWTRVGKFYLLLLSFYWSSNLSLPLSSTVSECVSQWVSVCAGMQRRWPAPCQGCFCCQVARVHSCLCECVCVWVCGCSIWTAVLT